MSIILYNHYIPRYLGSKFMIVIIFQSPKCNSNSIQKNLRSDHPILKKLKRGQEVTKAQRIHEADPSELIPLFTWFKTDKINPFPFVVPS